MNQAVEIVLYTLVFLGSFGLTFLYKRWAKKRTILDFPNERSSHESPVPRGGGIVFIFIFYVAIFTSYALGQLDKKLFLALIPGLVLAAVGFIDDYKSLTPALRMLFQLSCAGVSLYFLGGAKSPFSDNPSLLWTVIALIGVIWFINLFNFLDGSDGYASMEAISISLGISFFSNSNTLLFLAIAVVGFLYWNWPKAKVFMGDTGSITLGFILAITGIYLNNCNSLNISTFLLLTMLFWFDATVTIIRRIINREKLSMAHNKHIYQRAILGGYSHLKVLVIGIIINLFLFLLSFLANLNNLFYVPAFIIAFIVFSGAMIYVERRSGFDSSGSSEKSSDDFSNQNTADQH